MNYKGITFSKVPLSSLLQAVDWVETHGMLKPTTVMLKGINKGRYGKYDPNRGKIYLYDWPDPIPQQALVHELIHNWQWNGQDFTAGRLWELIPGVGKLDRYLSDPVEVEAWWWTDRYCSEVLGIVSPHRKDYEFLGVSHY